ncbi:hypothetical protein AK51_35405 [Serratia nematodiphila DZ0503SBS1]|nr:hypothetical protein AK51_35405 [Serratia nematodiphila DZ0503SBS1]
MEVKYSFENPQGETRFWIQADFRELRIDGNLYNVMMRQANNSISLVEAYIDRHLLLEEKKMKYRFFLMPENMKY